MIDNNTPLGKEGEIVIPYAAVQDDVAPTPPEMDFDAPTVQRGKNSAINLLIAIGAFTLPANHPMRGYVKPMGGGGYFPHNGEREMERRAKQVANGQIKLGDCKYGANFVSTVGAE